MKMKNVVLLIAPGRKTRGGITSVITQFEKTFIWEKFNIKWIESYIDRGAFMKVFYFLKSYIIFLFFLPNAKLIHIHFSEPVSAIRKYLFFTVAKLFRKKIIVHFHAFSAETTLYSNKKEIYRKLFSESDIIIVLSEIWKSMVGEFLNNSDKIKVLYNPCSTLSEGRKIYDKERVILFAGTLNKRKGFIDLLEAFALIADKYKDWKVVFAGSGDFTQGSLISQKYNISDQVHFTGWISGELKDKLFQQASIFCLPSYAEGFPMAVLDAWSYGLPVITTPVGGLRDIVKHKENALVTIPGDVKNLSSNLEELMTCKALREKIANESVRLSEEVFSINRISNELNKLYEQLLDTKSGTLKNGNYHSGRRIRHQTQTCDQ